MNVASSFPYSVHDEPTEEWTIEELLHWCLLQSQFKTTSKRDEIMNAYQDLFDAGKKEILDLQSEVTKIQQNSQEQQQEEGGGSSRDGKLGMKIGNDNSSSDNDNNNVENQHPNQESKGTSLSVSNAANYDTNTKSNPNPKPTTICIEIIQGLYKGSTYTLKPAIRKPCWIGRSTSKKFRERGISLNNDAEVSTTHGKFHIHPASGGPDSKLMYTDTGSTNGTVYNNEEIEDQVPLELVDGMVLVIGNSHFLIHLK